MPGPPLPADPASRVLHRDDAVLILDKPAGIAVHRGPGGAPSLEDWLPALRFDKRRDPQPAHRLDQDTAGCLVLGRTTPALRALGALFAAHRVEKTYWAVLRGTPTEPVGSIDAPLRKISTAAAGWRMVVDPAGQPARTDWRVLGVADGLAWVELRPRTGRTHQLRVHCASLGMPILGDARYGGGEGRMQLLARAIALPLDPPIAATARVPAHMRATLARLGG